MASADRNILARTSAETRRSEDITVGQSFAPACTADIPPRFGYSRDQVTWGWERDLNPSDYVRRLHAVNEAFREANSVSPLRAIDFHAGRFVSTIRALFESFGEANQRIETLADLSGTKADAANLRAENLFIERRSNEKEAARPVSRIDLDLEKIGFDVERYRNLPDSFKSFLKVDANLLLMPSLHDPRLIIVSLEPKGNGALADERYLEFIRRCSDLEIPAALSRSSIAGILGCYDVRELERARAGHTGYILFPQLSKAPERDTVSEIHKTFAERSSTAEISGSYEQRTQEDITTRFRSLLYKLGGGAINLKTFAEELKNLDPYFGDAERNEITLGLTTYLVSCITRGQLRDLNGLQFIPDDYRNALSFSPEDANRLRYFYQNIGHYSCLQIAESVTREGLATRRALGLDVPQEIKKLNPLSSSDYGIIWDSYDAPTDPRLQRALRTRLDAFVESKLPGELHRETGVDVAVEISRFAQIITLMQGNSAGIGDGLDAQIAVPIVLFLERAVGIKLEALRKQVVREIFGAKEILANIDAEIAAGRIPNQAPRLFLDGAN